MFNTLKIFIPPIVSNFIKRNLGYIGLATWEYAPKAFETKVKSGGWNLDSIALLQKEKWKAYSSLIKSTSNLGINHESEELNEANNPFFHNLLNSFAYVLSLSGLKKQEINFLDWGGGLGHYGLLAQELVKTSNIKVNYFCYDFDVFAKYGKEINAGYEFFSDESQFQDRKFDLLMASSSIWYEVDWKNGIDKLCKFDMDYLYITRMIFIKNNPSFVAIQRPKSMGYETEYLFWIINRFEFLEYVKSKNFSLVREFEFGQVSPIFKAPEQGTLQGFLFKRL